MASAEKVKLPKDRKGQTLHIGDEVFVFNGTDPVSQGEIISMTLVCFSRAIWSVDLHMGAIGDRRYRTSCGGFDPHGLERIEVGSND
ncbi:MAG: hypothetical protein PUE29_10355 [Olsenella sp.]|nr:hypothetical protein [Olsenella sp.]